MTPQSVHASYSRFMLIENYLLKKKCYFPATSYNKSKLVNLENYSVAELGRCTWSGHW